MPRAVDARRAAARARDAGVQAGGGAGLVEGVFHDPVVGEVARGLDREEVVRGVVRRPRFWRRHARAAPVAACSSELTPSARVRAREKEGRGRWRPRTAHSLVHWRHLYQDPELSTLPQK